MHVFMGIAMTLRAIVIYIYNIIAKILHDMFYRHFFNSKKETRPVETEAFTFKTGITAHIAKELHKVVLLSIIDAEVTKNVRKDKYSLGFVVA